MDGDGWVLDWLLDGLGWLKMAAAARLGDGCGWMGGGWE